MVSDQREIGANSVDLSWTGVPIPHQRYVNLYRILYQEENIVDPNPHSAFIISNINSISSSRIDLLRPSTAYQIWLEAYLRNGKVVKSNVLAITTQEGEDLPNQGNSLDIISIIDCNGSLQIRVIIRNNYCR